MYSLLYGKSVVTFTLPEGVVPDSISYHAEPAFVTEDIVNRSLALPVSSPPLRELAKSRENAVIIISDSSRLCPSHLFLESCLMN